MEKYISVDNIDSYYEQVVKRQMSSATVAKLVGGLVIILTAIVVSIVLMVTDKLCRQFAAVNEADPTDETAPNGTAVEAQLEHAFDFVEAAYGRDQELILFLTELSMRREAQTFLMAYPCERYYDYAAKYLSSDARTELQEDILANL